MRQHLDWVAVVAVDASVNFVLGTHKHGGGDAKSPVTVVVRELEDKYAEFSRAWVADGTVDPTEENVAKWNSESYPKDSDGNSIVDQIDKTIPGYEEWVRQFLAGEIDSLAGQAFNPNTNFNPPPWAESLLYLDATKGMAKSGPRIRCHLHMRDELKRFHELLYSRGFIERATDCDSYASVLIVRKPDSADSVFERHRSGINPHEIHDVS